MIHISDVEVDLWLTCFSCPIKVPRGHALLLPKTIK